MGNEDLQHDQEKNWRIIMPSWNTSLILNHNQWTINVPNVKTKRGIYQGDSLSPLIFIMTIDPLSKLLNKSNTEYNFKNRYEHPNVINHLLYMDDLKLYAANQNQFTKQLEIVKKFSEDICMDFGLDECATLNLTKGRQSSRGGIQLDHTTLTRN